MALIQSTAIPSGATDYELEQGLKFEDGNEPKLTFTPSTAGNRKKITVSVWAKRGKLGASNSIISSGGRFDTAVVFNSNDKIEVFTNYAEVYRGIQTSAVFRDNSSWYHIVATWDTNNSTSTNRHIVWVNGVRQAVGSETTMPQNGSTELMNTTEHTIGTGGRYQNQNQLDGYLAEMHVIDGQVLTPADFGETGTYGEWKPIEYSGTYGTNGFYLPFKQDYTVEGFSTVTYKGNATNQYIGGVGFSPDLVIGKCRDTASTPHEVIDTVRGTSKRLQTNSTGAETTASNDGFVSISNDGFLLDGTGGGGNFNGNGRQYVAWNWDMGGSNASNTDGSITSTVRANSTYGQSIVSWTGTGANATVGHGLTSAPEMLLVKNRDNATDWFVYHTSAGASKYLLLNSTAAEVTNTSIWQNTAPSSSVVTLGDAYQVNGSHNMIMYAFHSVTGYSKFGSYTGNGNASGTSVTTGFEPAFVMVKGLSGDMTHKHWTIRDNTRSPNNDRTKGLHANKSEAEFDASNNAMAFSSTGFQLKGTDPGINENGTEYIYMAFADTREYAYWLDQSGNNNDWTSNNLTESDISVDSPTNNFATLNPLHNNAGILSEGNLKYTDAGSDGWNNSKSTLGVSSGKWYWEMYANNVVNSVMCASIAGESHPLENLPGQSHNTGVTYYAPATYYYNPVTGNSGSSYGNTYTNGDVISVALDMDVSGGKVYFAKNGVWQNSGNPVNGTNPAASGFLTYDDIWFASSGTYYSGTAQTFNFGQDSSFAGNKTAQGNQDGNDIGDFYYTPPTGFLALCTKNLPDVAVTPSEHFNTVLYNGTGSAQSITGVGFQPDFVWIKMRSHADNHVLNDSVRGQSALYSNATNAENTGSTFVTSRDSDGFSVGTDPSVNYSAGNHVAWNWKANGTGSSNTDGDVTSTVSANVDAGFSIVSWSGNNGVQTIGHGLSKAPEIIIRKSRSTGYGAVVTGSVVGSQKYMYLYNTNAAATHSPITDPTSTVFNGWGVDSNTPSMIAYCFHSVDGYSKVGSYIANGEQDDGTFIYTGFRPAFVMIKKTSASASWYMTDSERYDTNRPYGSAAYLFAESSAAESTTENIDMLSNGFKARRDSGYFNYPSGATYIYIAFAETPFKYSNAR